ncbi:hypothetical protein EPUL_001702 [Erysiphe pulchra]|uniref:Uncharacterized protein n=1 Tax=Erysiphe pulchra TaxID=225359 RepID=A0A2S4PT72_9PEZI|nr:hypothetical protein EPUL_001702 [Erysiphe pulchra]
MFQNIACNLDDTMSAQHLPRHLHAPFRKLVVDLNAVAKRHFESYVNGIQSTLPQNNITKTFTKKANFAAMGKKLTNENLAATLPIKPQVAIFPAVPSLRHLNSHHSKQQQLPNKTHKHKSASAPALCCQTKEDQKLPSKAEIAKILQVASAARLRLVAAHCKPISTQKNAQATTADDYINNTAPSTPPTVRRLFIASPSPARGRFATLQTPYGSRKNSLTKNSLLAKYITSFVQHGLGNTSDHLPVLILLPIETPRIYVEPKLRFSTIDERISEFLLLMSLSSITPLQTINLFAIDTRAEELISILQNSFQGIAGKHDKNIAKWHVPEMLRRPTRSIFGGLSRRLNAYFIIKKIDEAIKAKDIFDIVKWHRSKGVFQTHLLHNPLAPDDLPAQTFEAKSDVFVNNLLCN